MREFFLSRIRAFRYAFQGWGYVLRTQRNMWIHSLIAAVVFVLGLWLKLSLQDWAIITLTAALVFIAEFINTSIEAIVDLATEEHHPLAKIGKDVGAAAVLVAALAAVIVGFLILGPPLWLRLISISMFD